MIKTKNILLINPEQNSYYRGIYPSGALMLIGTMCQNQGHNVKIIDATVNDISVSKMKSLISSFNPDIAGITINTFQTKNAKIWLNAIKELNNNIITVVGGPHPSAMGLEIFKDFQNIDISVIGEGEFTFLEIVDGRKLEEIKGICYNGKANEPRPLAANLDHIPLSNFDLVDLTKYSALGIDNSMFIMASRGCPSRCIYCNKSIFGTKVRYRQPIKVIEDIKWMHEKCGIKFLYFQDDTFNLNRKWIEEILTLIIKNGLNTDISYMVAFRANKNLVDEKLLELAKKANIKQIFYGVESGNQEMLDRMQKGITIDEIKRAFELTHKAGIKAIAAFIIGLPGENENTIQDTINLWKEINPDYTGFTMATPYPNTVFHKILVEKNHILNGNYDNYHLGGNYVRSDELSREELEFYTALLIITHAHKWILKLPFFPFFPIGRNKILCNISVFGIRRYKWLRDNISKIVGKNL